MGHGLLHRGSIHRLARPGPKRPTGGREQNASNIAGLLEASVARPECLEDGVVFTVDGQNRGARAGCLRHHQASRTDQGLLVGQEHPLAGSHRPPYRGQACHPNNAGHHGVHLREARQFAQALGARQSKDMTLRRPAQGLAEMLSGQRV